MHSKLHSNIWKIALSDAIYGFGLIGGIYILYYEILGYTPMYRGLYEGITSIAIMMSDLFTGVIADRIGRKNSVLLSNLCFFLLSLLLGCAYWVSKGLLVILIFGGILNGLEFSFRSGAKTALLYDTLIRLRIEEKFLKIQGRIQAITIISNVIGMSLGGFLFGYFTALPYLSYFLRSVLIILASIILFTIQEPYVKKGPPMSFWKNVKMGVKFIFHSKSLLWLTVFFLFAGVFAESYWDLFSQEHLKLLGAPYVGVIFAIITGICAIVIYFIDKIEKRVGKRWMLYGIIGIQVLLFLGFAWVSKWYTQAVLLLLLSINYNATWLVADKYENLLIPSEHRAAILSARSFLANSLFGGGLIIFLMGLLIEKVQIQILFSLTAVCIFLINGSLLIVRDVQNKRNQLMQ